MRTLFIACLLALMPYTVKGQMDTTTVRLLRKADSLMYVMWGRIADEMVTRSDVRRMIDSALVERDGTTGAGVVIETLYVTPEGWWIHRPPRPDSCMKIDTTWVECKPQHKEVR